MSELRLGEVHLSAIMTHALHAGKWSYMRKCVYLDKEQLCISVNLSTKWLKQDERR